MAKTKSSEPKRYYRSNLETIVWDAENNRVLADFGEGHFTTDDVRTQKILEGFGYVQIPLDAAEPPDIIVNKPTTEVKGDVPVMRGNVPPIVAEKKMGDVTKTVGGPQAPQTVDAQAPAVAPKPKRSRRK
jgi:hypothetical protein